MSDQEKNVLNLPADGARDHLRGNPQAAAVVIVEYGDYESPESRRAHFLGKKLLEDFATHLSLIFRYFRLAPDGSRKISRPAQAAEAAAAQGKFWEMHDILFARQENLENGYLVEYAAEINLDVERFLRDLSAHKFDERIDEDFKSAAASGVGNVPAFFINGERYRGEHDYESLVVEIRKHVQNSEKNTRRQEI